MEPLAESLPLPVAYGAPKDIVRWEEVRAKLEAAPHYWIATVRPDGRPHVVPVDGLWVDDVWYHGGAPETVRGRNLERDPRVVIHLDDGAQAVIVEGTAEVVRATPALAKRLVTASRAKYGYAPPASTYTGGVWALRPERAFAWTSLPKDATRYTFA